MTSSDRAGRISASASGQVGGTPFRRLAAAFLLLLIGGCESFPTEPTLNTTENRLGEQVERPSRPSAGEALIGEDGRESAQPFKRPFEERFRSSEVPALTEAGTDAGQDTVTPPEPGSRMIDAAVPPLALPRFIDVVFGEMLQVPYSTGPEIADRREVIQLRSSGRMSAEDFLRLVSKALRTYGVRVSPEEGLYVIMSSQTALERRPRFIRARSFPTTPTELRPVVQFVPLRAIDPTSMHNLLLQAFPRGGDLEVQRDATSGALILIGLPEDVSAAIDIIKAMDELSFAGSTVVSYKPIFWNAEALSEQVATVLRAEGWQVSTDNRQLLHIHLVPVAFSNSLLAFVKSQKAYDRVRHWLEFLDQPKETGEGDRIFVYDVENADAQIIADVANAVLEGTRGPGREGQEGGQGQQQEGQQGESLEGGRGGLVIDPHGNRIIYSGSPSEYQRILPLLRRLDQPTPEVLIEVTVAEVTLTDETQYGVEFFAENVGGDGVDVDFGTQGGLGLGSNGFNVGFVSGDVQAALNAFAQNQRVNVLSTPRLVARSGGAASIQVGTDVPVITSQQATDQQSGTGGTDVFQSVQFRQTGVLLNIEPIVFGSGRVDLDVSQEVSNAQPNPNQAIASPIIQNRNITTQLTLDDGGTAVLGGLIQDNVVRGDTGIPLLKDIPLLGSLFSVDSLSVERTELLVVITAYIIRSGEDRKRFVDYLTNQINESLADPFQLRTRLPRQDVLREVGDDSVGAAAEAGADTGTDKP